MAAEARVMAAAPARPILPGLLVLFRKELAETRRSRRAVIFAGIMTMFVVLTPVIGFFEAEVVSEGARKTVIDQHMRGMLGTWAGLTAYIGSLMVIASTLDAVTRERNAGVTAWIATKPVSRLSYLLAKALAYSVTSIAAIVIVPTMFWALFMVLMFNDVPWGHVGIGVVVLSAEMAFLSFFTVALGVPFRSVAAVALSALAVWFLPGVLPAFEELRWTYGVLPAYLPFVAIKAAVGDLTQDVLTVPLASLAFALSTFLVAALRFDRQEL
jgi:ABC-2 type transport system permease protein